jgi:LuxR family maltose regulon positive regulatory protein
MNFKMMSLIHETLYGLFRDPYKALNAAGLEAGQQVVVVASQSSQPLPIQTLLTTLINEIAAMPERFTLVLDDYHLITAQPIHNALTFLLDHLPPQMHLVITTRADPPLPLARLRARGQLTESDLRFTTGEAAAFLNRVMGLNLAPDHVTALESRTETRAACQSPLTITS